MWYFSWMLGVLLAAAFGIINVMWLELVAADAFGEEEEADPQSASSAQTKTGDNR